LNRFREFLLATSSLLKVSLPKCSTAKELRLLIEHKGVLEGFVCFCSSKGLASKSISGYINGLKHFASDLEDVPSIAGAAVVARMLVGQVKLGKRSNGVLEGFVCFCSSKGLASKSISGYINGLKHFRFRLGRCS
jgi:hypothetical protein